MSEAPTSTNGMAAASIINNNVYYSKLLIHAVLDMSDLGARFCASSNSLRRWNSAAAVFVCTIKNGRLDLQKEKKNLE